MRKELLKSIFRGLCPTLGVKTAALLALAVGFFGIPLAAQQDYVVTIEIEEASPRTYVAGDPVSMTVTVTNVKPDGDCGSVTVDVHLTPDNNFRTDTDHVLTQLSGPSLGPGQSFTWFWVQRMPAHLSGTFFVNAEAYTWPGVSPACGGETVSPFVLETAKIDLIEMNHPETSLVTLGESGEFGNGNSETPSMSQDGRWVTFASEATTLVPGLEASLVSDIFIRDQLNGEVERITWPVSGNDPDGPSYLPRLSADEDARWIVFHSSASNLIGEQVNNDAFDVYRHDRQTNETILVSRSRHDRAANGHSQFASVSADGRWVAFHSEATDLVANDTNNVTDIFVADMDTGDMRRVNVTNLGIHAQSGHSRNARISADGRHIVFESLATNLSSGGKKGLWEIYVHDRDANENGTFDEPNGIATVRLSVSYDEAGNPVFSDGHSVEANLSPDGRFVTFKSGATTLFSEPAQGLIALLGTPAEATLRFQENTPAEGTIGFQPDQFSEGTIEFQSNPSDSDSIQISNGEIARTFEFDGPVVQDGVAPGNVRVVIGGSPTTTRNELIAQINDAFFINDEQTMLAVAETIDGNPGIRVTNIAYGSLANQPIDGTNAPSLDIAGMSAAQVSNPASGDTLEIDTGRTPPVTISFFTGTDPTDHNARLLGVEIGRTAKETSLNMIEVLRGLGYDDYDLPMVPDYLLPPEMENPEHHDSFTFSKTINEGLEDEEVIQQTFFFIEGGLQFDPANPQNVRIEATPEATRGNLMRALSHFFAFEPLPAVFESSGNPVVFGEGFLDAQAHGAISLRVMPEPGHTLTISDGLLDANELPREVEFRFAEEPEVEEDEVPPAFTVVNPDTVLVHIVEDQDLSDAQELAMTENRLAMAIRATLNISVGFGESEDLDRQALLLRNNDVGAFGNFPIVKSPVRTQEELDEGEEPWAYLFGMEGGVNGTPDDSDRIVFYPENLLHPRVIFEFRDDLEDVSPDAHFGVQRGATGGETEGNFLAVLIQSGLPWLTVEGEPDPDNEGEENPELPNVHLSSLVGTPMGDVNFNFLPSSPGTFAILDGGDGSIHSPPAGVTVTLNDEVNPPVTFEFTQAGSVHHEDNVPVMVYVTDPAATRDSFLHAVNETDNLNVEAEIPEGGTGTLVRVVRTEPGPVDDPLIEIDGQDGMPAPRFITIIEDLDGEWNPREYEAFVLRDGINSPVTFEFVDDTDDLSDPSYHPVIIGADRGETRDNLIAAIKDSGLQIRALPVSEGGNPAVRLTHFATGPVGNFPIVILTPNPTFSVSGMTGGGSLANGTDQVYLVDRDANDNGSFDEFGNVSMELISKTPLGTTGNRASGEPAVSADGRFVAFRSLADDLLPLTVTRSDGEVFTNIVDPITYTETIIGDDGPEIRFAAVDLSSEIARLTDVDDFSDIYLYDRSTGVHRRVDVNRFGESLLASSMSQIVGGAPRSSRSPALSADGRYIVFEADDEPFDISYSRLTGDQDIREGGLWHGRTNRAILDGPNNFRDIYVHDQRYLDGGPEFDGEVVLTSAAGNGPLAVGTTIHLTAEAFDLEEGRTVSQMQFFVDGQPVGAAQAPVVPNTNTFAGSFSRDEPGIYRVTAVATDSRGRVLPVSNVVSIEIVPVSGASSPGVSIVSPNQGDVFTNTSSVLITANAADPDGDLVGVQFYVDGAPHGDEILREASPAPADYPYSVMWLPTTIGAHTITAVARDNSGNIVMAAPRSVYVTHGETMPTVTVTAPDAGALLRLFDDNQREASATAIVGPLPNREITSIAVLDGGAGYTSAPSVRIIGSGLDAFATATVTDGRVTEIEVVNPGRGYTQASVVFEGGFSLDPVFIQASASPAPDTEITTVEFFVNGRQVGDVARAAPYQVGWRPSGMGLFQIVAVAKDDKGNQWTSDVVEVEVGPRNGAPPDVAIVSPAVDAAITSRSTVKFSAVASDADGTVDRVAFYANGFHLGDGERQQASDFFVLHDNKMTDMGVGDYSILAIATDNNGNISHSAIRGVTVVQSTGPVADPPELTLSSPMIGRGQSVMMTVRAADTGPDLVSAQFFANGEPISGIADDDEEEGLLRLIWTPEASGNYNISAMALDVNGNLVRSLPYDLVLEVRGVNGVAPSVVIVSPAEEFTATTASVWPLAAMATVREEQGPVTVEFFLGGKKIGNAERDQDSSTFRLNFDFEGTEPGLHDLVAVARDSIGNATASLPVEVIVVGASGLPNMTASLTISGGTLDNGGVQNFTFNQLIQSQVQASSSAGRVASVEFFMNGISFPELDESSPNPVLEPPFVYVGQIVVAGNYNMYAVATDTFGNTIVTDAVPFRVNASASGPSVEITDPKHGDQFTVGISGDGEGDDGALTGAAPVPVRLRIEPDVGTIKRVEFLVNNVVVETRTSAPFTRWDWLADQTGEIVLSARVINSTETIFQSDAVTIEVLPLGVVPGNPADPDNHVGFVIQTYFDLLQRAPSAVELNTFVAGLEGNTGPWPTRGQVVEKIMTHSEFDVVSWVIATYLTVLREAPSQERLFEGILLLTGDGDGADDDVILGPDVPVLLPLLVLDILGSDEFWVKFSYDGLDAEHDDLLDDLDKGKTFPRHQEKIFEMDALGRDIYLAELTVENFSEDREDILRSAMILLLLDRDVMPGEVASLPSNIAKAAQQIVESRQYANRFSDAPNFFGIDPDEASLSGEQVSDWFGRFNDSHFDHMKGLGWIAHKEHGWLYVGGEGHPEGLWLWDHTQQKWIWTRHDIYPRLFKDQPGQWLFYHKGGKPSLRVFQSHNGSVWSGPFEVRP